MIHHSTECNEVTRLCPGRIKAFGFWCWVRRSSLLKIFLLYFPYVFSLTFERRYRTVLWNILVFNVCSISATLSWPQFMHLLQLCTFLRGIHFPNSLFLLNRKKTIAYVKNICSVLYSLFTVGWVQLICSYFIPSYVDIAVNASLQFKYIFITHCSKQNLFQNPLKQLLHAAAYN